ncbi:electron transport complex protein RnfB [Clostridia bacterium]|nr:electron transport complex protein RnfB [Clostridia bacterium]
MQIWYAIAVLGGIGLVFGLILAGASKVFAVPRDERYDDLIKTLPGANCGGCGFAGCEAYAVEVLAGNAATNLCPVGGEEVSARLAEVMGVQLTKNTRFTALVKCSGGVRARKKFQYAGINDCVAAQRIGGGLLECRYGCLGLGTCVRACPFGAISVVDGVALVDHERCTGCMRCAEVCPKGVVQAVPYYADVNVCCSSKEKGASLRKMCEIGCIGCRLCEKVCKQDAIHVEGNLAVIDHEKCNSCGDCAEKCPRKLIVDANLDRGPRIDTEELIKEA